MENLTFNIGSEIRGKINEYLPNNAKLLFLSLTGSRAFGWATDNQDYDVHGIILCDNYWDYVHLGKIKYDINLYEFSHLSSDIENQHFEEFMNWSNPFYVDSRFDFNELLSFCTLNAVKQKEADIDVQINKFKFDKAPRTALHAYRILMIPLYFIENRKFELNIFKINEKYNFEQLGKLKDAYNSSGSEFDITKVNADLDYLFNMYKVKVASCAEKSDRAKANQWMNKVRSIYKE